MPNVIPDYATGTTVPAAAVQQPPIALNTSGNARDLFRQLAGRSFDRSQSVPQPLAYDPRIAEILKSFYDNQNKAEGLSPEAKAAMNSEATSGLPARYNDAAKALRTSLMQRGVYGGQLPANAGELLRDFEPLQSDMVNAQSKAGRDTILADEQAKVASLLNNRNLALQAVGVNTNMTNQQNQDRLASFNAGTQALSDTLYSAANLGNLEQTSVKNIALSSAISAGTKALLDPGNLSKIIKGIRGGGAAAASASTAAGLASTAAPGTIAAGGLGSTGAVAGTTATASGASAAGAGTAAVPGVTGSTGLGATLSALASNPITWAVAGAITAAIVWKKSQAHPTADKFVQGFQNPFGDHLLKSIGEFDKAIASGQMDKSSAIIARNEIAQLINSFEEDREKFAARGKKEAKVASQAHRTMVEDFGQNYSRIIGGMDQKIQALAA